MHKLFSSQNKDDSWVGTAEAKSIFFKFNVRKAIENANSSMASMRYKEIIGKITIEPWEDDEVVICVDAMPIGKTLGKRDALVVSKWLMSAFEDLKVSTRTSDAR